MCSGITRGRVLSGELYAHMISQVNLSAFIYRLFHKDFSLMQNWMRSGEW